jgi:hypothetical protein
LPVDAGQTTAYPNLGITPPPPNYLLEPAMLPPGRTVEPERRWQRRFGVTHSVWGAGDDVGGAEVVAEITDPALDRVMASVPSLGGSSRGPWKLVRTPSAFRPAWVARRVREAPSWGRLYSELSLADAPDEAWFLPEDRPPAFPGTGARAARLRSWDGRAATVEHDGSCILILRRTYYPGWVRRVDGGPEQPVLKVDGGLQGVQLAGSGTSHVVVRYQPTGLARAVTVTLAAVAAAVLILSLAGWKALRGRTPPRRWRRSSDAPRALFPQGYTSTEEL